MVIVLPNRDCLVYRWFYCGSYINMKIKDIEKKIGTLSNPSKMPSYAWGISAKHCNTGSKLAKIKVLSVINVMHSRVITLLRMYSMHMR